tara:strand:+ start:10663 stop:16692 length:6030 start_codon:yes stop_codon:yes gene_type:complete
MAIVNLTYDIPSNSKLITNTSQFEILVRNLLSSPSEYNQLLIDLDLDLNFDVPQWHWEEPLLYFKVHMSHEAMVEFNNETASIIFKRDILAEDAVFGTGAVPEGSIPSGVKPDQIDFSGIISNIKTSSALRPVSVNDFTDEVLLENGIPGNRCVMISRSKLLYDQDLLDINMTIKLNKLYSSIEKISNFPAKTIKKYSKTIQEYTELINDFIDYSEKLLEKKDAFISAIAAPNPYNITDPAIITLQALIDLGVGMLPVSQPTNSSFELGTLDSSSAGSWLPSYPALSSIDPARFNSQAAWTNLTNWVAHHTVQQDYIQGMPTINSRDEEISTAALGQKLWTTIVLSLQRSDTSNITEDLGDLATGASLDNFVESKIGDILRYKTGGLYVNTLGSKTAGATVTGFTQFFAKNVGMILEGNDADFAPLDDFLSLWDEVVSLNVNRANAKILEANSVSVLNDALKTFVNLVENDMYIANVGLNTYKSNLNSCIDTVKGTSQYTGYIQDTTMPTKAESMTYQSNILEMWSGDFGNWVEDSYYWMVGEDPTILSDFDEDGFGVNEDAWTNDRRIFQHRQEIRHQSSYQASAPGLIPTSRAYNKEFRDNGLDTGNENISSAYEPIKSSEWKAVDFMFLIKFLGQHNRIFGDDHISSSATETGKLDYVRQWMQLQVAGGYYPCLHNIAQYIKYLTSETENYDNNIAISPMSINTPLGNGWLDYYYQSYEHMNSPKSKWLTPATLGYSYAQMIEDGIGHDSWYWAYNRYVFPNNNSKLWTEWFNQRFRQGFNWIEGDIPYYIGVSSDHSIDVYQMSESEQSNSWGYVDIDLSPSKGNMRNLSRLSGPEASLCAHLGVTHFGDYWADSNYTDQMQQSISSHHGEYGQTGNLNAFITTGLCINSKLLFFASELDFTRPTNKWKSHIPSPGGYYMPSESNIFGVTQGISYASQRAVGEFEEESNTTFFLDYLAGPDLYFQDNDKTGMRYDNVNPQLSQFIDMNTQFGTKIMTTGSPWKNLVAPWANQSKQAMYAPNQTHYFYGAAVNSSRLSADTIFTSNDKYQRAYTETDFDYPHQLAFFYSPYHLAYLSCEVYNKEEDCNQYLWQGRNAAWKLGGPASNQNDPLYIVYDYDNYEKLPSYADAGESYDEYQNFWNYSNLNSDDRHACGFNEWNIQTNFAPARIYYTTVSLLRKLAQEFTLNVVKTFKDVSSKYGILTENCDNIADFEALLGDQRYAWYGEVLSYLCRIAKEEFNSQGDYSAFEINLSGNGSFSLDRTKPRVTPNDFNKSTNCLGQHSWRSINQYANYNTWVEIHKRECSALWAPVHQRCGLYFSNGESLPEYCQTSLTPWCFKRISRTWMNVNKSVEKSDSFLLYEVSDSSAGFDIQDYFSDVFNKSGELLSKYKGAENAQSTSYFNYGLSQASYLLSVGDIDFAQEAQEINSYRRIISFHPDVQFSTAEPKLIGSSYCSNFMSGQVSNGLQLRSYLENIRTQFEKFKVDVPVIGALAQSLNKIFEIKGLDAVQHASYLDRHQITLTKKALMNEVGVYPSYIPSKYFKITSSDWSLILRTWADKLVNPKDVALGQGRTGSPWKIVTLGIPTKMIGQANPYVITYGDITDEITAPQPINLIKSPRIYNTRLFIMPDDLPDQLWNPLIANELTEKTDTLFSDQTTAGSYAWDQAISSSNAVLEKLLIPKIKFTLIDDNEIKKLSYDGSIDGTDSLIELVRNDIDTGLFAQIPSGNAPGGSGLGYLDEAFIGWLDGTADDCTPEELAKFIAYNHIQDFLCKAYHEYYGGLTLEEETFLVDDEIQNHVYSPEAVENDDSTFPWVKGDFNERKPIIEVDSDYSLSSMIIPDTAIGKVASPKVFDRVFHFLEGTHNWVFYFFPNLNGATGVSTTYKAIDIYEHFKDSEDWEIYIVSESSSSFRYQDFDSDNSEVFTTKFIPWDTGYKLWVGYPTIRIGNPFGSSQHPGLEDTSIPISRSHSRSAILMLKPKYDGNLIGVITYNILTAGGQSSTPA